MTVSAGRSGIDSSHGNKHRSVEAQLTPYRKIIVKKGKENFYRDQPNRLDQSEHRTHRCVERDGQIQYRVTGKNAISLRNICFAPRNQAVWYDVSGLVCTYQY